LHFVFHFINTLRNSIHFFIDPLLQISYFIKISSTCFNFNLKLGRSHLSIIKLTLLKVKILSHFVDWILWGKFVLTSKVLLHVLKQSSSNFLVVCYLTFILIFFNFKFCSEILYLFFLLIKNFVLLGILTFSWRFTSL
jgi:hypothetical protein